MRTTTLTETLAERFSVAQLARKENVHIATCWRWLMTGVRGIRLRSIRVGGRRYVLDSDWLDFSAKLNADLTDASQTPPRSEGRRRKDSDAARDALRRSGI